MNNQDINYTKIICELVIGMVGGTLVGSLVGALAISKTSFQKNQYQKITVVSIILSFVIPLIAGAVLFGPPYEEEYLLLVPMVIITALMLSFIPSLLTTLLLNWNSFFKKQT